jgi:hypothetical protein
MIRAAGGAEHFYSSVYVHAVCPLGFVKEGPTGGPINLNYYDDKDLEKAVTPFVENWLRTLVGTGMRRDLAICIGTGKNAKYFTALNDRLGLFKEVIPLEHPRYVMQYKAKSLEFYIAKYLAVLERIDR